MWTATPAPARTIAASIAAALATIAASAASPHSRQWDFPPPCGEGLGAGGLPASQVLESPPPCRSPARGEGTLLHLRRLSRDDPLLCERAPRIRLANEGFVSPFSFLESLFGVPPPPRRPPVYRSGPRRELSPPGRGRQGRTPPPAPAAVGDDPGASGSGVTYRTLCVRLCDGYYWPISFATDKAHLSRDGRTCARSCSAPAALYYHPNPGGAPEDMVSLDGVPYKSLGTAYLFRAGYDANCKCRPHPWEKEALERSKPSAQAKEARTATRRSKR